MFIYNVTINVENSIHEDWLSWMHEKHIGEVMATGCFLSYRMCKVVGDDPGATYAVQYTFESMADLDRYQEAFAPKLRAELQERYGEKAVAFRTLLKIVASS